ncbi:class III lanthipeptide [Paenibacillus thiaminolyticus]
MNAVLELQKLAHDTDGKGQAIDATPTTTAFPPPIFSTVSVSAWECLKN